MLVLEGDAVKALNFQEGYKLMLRFTPANRATIFSGEKLVRFNCASYGTAHGCFNCGCLQNGFHNSVWNGLNAIIISTCFKAHRLRLDVTKHVCSAAIRLWYTLPVIILIPAVNMLVSSRQLSKRNKSICSFSAIFALKRSFLMSVPLI